MVFKVPSNPTSSMIVLKKKKNPDSSLKKNTNIVPYIQLQKCRGKYKSPYTFSQIINYNIFKNCGELLFFNCLNN